MSDLGEVLSTSVDADDSSLECNVQLTEADNADGGVFVAACVDSPPLPGDDAACMAITDGTGEFAAVGFSGVESKAAPGEARIVARNADKVEVAELWMRADGQVTLSSTGFEEDAIPTTLTLDAEGAWSLSNEFGGISLASDGTVDINGVKFSPAGTVVTAAGTDVDLHTHTAPPGGGPTSPPI